MRGRYWELPQFQTVNDYNQKELGDFAQLFLI